MPAVFVGEVAQDLAADRGPGFGGERGGLGQRPSLGDGGLEVEPVVVPDSLLFLHVSVSFLRAVRKDIIAKKSGKEEKRARAAKLLQSLGQVTQHHSSYQYLNEGMI